MPRSVSQWTLIALGTRSHPENRGAASSVQDPGRPIASAQGCGTTFSARILRSQHPEHVRAVTMV